ncbi:MAG: phosphonate C-P lyase system protein PhnH [Rhizobiales bacterium]|nr:phosphonate C-P lyase system protein PhnH [Hyphomicrobiales bacterium]
MLALAPGFADGVQSSQRVFRQVMNAFARPGTVCPLTESVEAPAPLSRGAAMIALTLCDHDTRVWLDPALAAAPAVAEWLRFHTGAPIAARPADAALAFVADVDPLPDLMQFAQGTAEYPDRSTTLVVQVRDLANGPKVRLTGPGVKGHATLCAAGRGDDFVVRMQRNRAQFPCGVDLLFVTEHAVAALPRSIQVEAEG